MRGVPLRVKEDGYSVDSLLMSDGLPFEKLKGTQPIAANPYFGKDEPFSHAKFGVRLACRLDGYSLADAKALVARSLAARPVEGPFLLDEAENRKTGGYAELQGDARAGRHPPGGRGA